MPSLSLNQGDILAQKRRDLHRTEEKIQKKIDSIRKKYANAGEVKGQKLQEFSNKNKSTIHHVSVTEINNKMAAQKTLLKEINNFKLELQKKYPHGCKNEHSSKKAKQQSSIPSLGMLKGFSAAGLITGVLLAIAYFSKAENPVNRVVNNWSSSLLPPPRKPLGNDKFVNTINEQYRPMTGK